MEQCDLFSHNQSRFIFEMILVAATHFGAMTMGADIDIRVVRDGRGPNCNIWSNFKQYGLPMPLGLLRVDNNLPPWHPGLKEDFTTILVAEDDLRSESSVADLSRFIPQVAASPSMSHIISIRQLLESVIWCTWITQHKGR